MMIKTIFSVLPKVMKSVLPKVSAQSVEGVRFLDVAWSDAFGVALSDAGAAEPTAGTTEMDAHMQAEQRPLHWRSQQVAWLPWS